MGTPPLKPHISMLTGRFPKGFRTIKYDDTFHASLFSRLYARDQAYSNFESIDKSLPNLATDFLSGYETMAGKYAAPES